MKETYIDTCKKHGETEHFIRDGGGKRCRVCTRESTKKRSDGKKLELVNYFGGRCVRCGYNKCIQALDFHHRDPSTKKFRISGSHCRSSKSIMEEALKCDLLCSNCHREVHAGL